VERLVSYFYPVALNMSRNAPVTVRDLCRLCRLRTSWVIRTLCRETQLREDGPNELYEGIIRRRRQRPCSPFIRENENLLLTSAGICFLIQQHHGIRDIAIGLLVELVRRLVEIIIHLSHSHAEFRDRDATAHVEFRERRVERANTAINLLGEGSTRLRSQNSTMRDAYRSFVQVVDPEETSARNYLSTLQGRRVNGSVMNQLAPLGKSMMAILENQALEFITGRDARDEMIRIHNDNPTLTRERKQAMCRSKVENAYYRGIAARVGRCVREMLARPVRRNRRLMRNADGSLVYRDATVDEYISRIFMLTPQRPNPTMVITTGPIPMRRRRRGLPNQERNTPQRPNPRMALTPGPIPRRRRRRRDLPNQARNTRRRLEY